MKYQIWKFGVVFTDGVRNPIFQHRLAFLKLRNKLVESLCRLSYTSVGT